jgi:MFS family permease
MTDTQYSSFRWFILVTMVIVTATTSMALIAPASVFSILFGSMPGLNPGQVVQAAMTIFNFVLGFAALFGGFLLDKLGPLKVFIGGLILIAIGAILMPIMGSTFGGMLFIRVLQGAGTGPVMAAAAPIAASYFPKQERSIATGAQGFAVAFGIIMGLQIVPRLATSPEDVFNALRILAPVTIVGIVLSIIALFGPKAVQEDKTEGPVGDAAAVGKLYKKALADPVLWVVIVCFMLMSGIFQQYNTIIQPYLASDAPLGLGRGALAGANALTLGTILFCIGSFLSGIVCEKVFKGNPRPVIAIGFLVGAITAFAIKFDFITASHGLLVFVIVVMGFFFSWVNPQTQSYLAKNYAKEITGKLGGLSMFMGISIGSTVAVWVLGLALSATGTYMLPISIMGSFCVAGFIVSLFIKQKNG